MSTLLPQAAQAAAYSLDPNPYLYACPFYHADQAQFEALMSTAKAQLAAKIQGDQACAAALSQVVSNLDTIAQSVQTINPALQQQITSEFLGQFLLDLQARKSQLEVGGQTAGVEYATLITTLDSIQTQLVSNHINEAFVARSSRDTQNTTYRQNLFGTMNQLVVSLKNTDPRCLASMGGWNTVFPAVLSVASVASGFSGFGSQAILSSALTLVANIADLLRDRDAKVALSQIQDFQNAQVLECTYYSMKYASCELQRAFRLSEDTAKIQSLIRKKYSPGVEGEWEKLFRFLDDQNVYNSLYDRVASMGTPLTIDTQLLTEYITALQQDPNSAPKVPDATALPVDKQRWLIELKLRGFPVNANDAFGRPLSLDQQIEEAKKIINNAIAKIQFVTETLQQNQSFYDLRAELETRYPQFHTQVYNLQEFLKKYISAAHSSNASPTLREGAGTISLILKVLLKLQDFLAVPYDDTSIGKFCELKNPHDPAGLAVCLTTTTREDAYIGLSNEAGFKLFGAMAEGTIAQISKQSVLTVAAKVNDRQNRALQVIINHFVDLDLATQHLDSRSGQSFTEYMRDRALYSKVAANYSSFQGPGKTNRIDFVNATLSNFEDGFESEILGAIELATSSTSDILPELNGKTGGHLCSLFSSMLIRKAQERDFFGPSRASRVWKKCVDTYKTLDLIDFPNETGSANLTGLKELPIRWMDPCFYSDYNRNFEMQSFILDRIRQKAPATTSQ